MAEVRTGWLQFRMLATTADIQFLKKLFSFSSFLKNKINIYYLKMQ